MTPHIGTVIMAHERRRAWAEELAAKLDAAIVWDHHNDRVETGLRCLEAHREVPEATHWLIVQDDAIVCHDLVPALERAVQVSGDRILSLYIGNGAPLSRFRLGQLARSADQAGVSWIEWPGTIWGVAILVPVAPIEDLIASYRRDPLTNYDTRLENAARKCGVPWWYPWPSLVDHRHGPSSPSLVPGRTNTNRHAWRFLGATASALSIDWTCGVYVDRERRVRAVTPPDYAQFAGLPRTTR